MIRCRFLTRTEYREREEARRAYVREYFDRAGNTDWTPELSAENRTFFPPGTMWECPWYFDPASLDADQKIADAIAAINAGASRHLSIHYWKDWAKIRPPFEVMCPNHSSWVVDAKSNNGTGWVVKGSAPELIVTPSIWSRQGEPDAYHGFLGSNGAQPGYFSAAL